MRYILTFFFSRVFFCSVNAKDFYVSKSDNDKHSGSLGNPFATIYRAQEEARKFKNEVVNIYIRQRNYYLSKTIVFADANSRKDGVGL